MALTLTKNGTTVFNPVTAEGAARGADMGEAQLWAQEMEAHVLSANTRASLRNLIINGGFDIWQRGTSFALSAASSTYTADRWRGFTAANVSSVISRQAFTAGSAPVAGYEGQYYLRCVGTVASGTPVYGIEQSIEDVRTTAGRNITVSFWAKSSVAISGVQLVEQQFGSGGSSAVNCGAPTLSFTTSWQSFTYTIAMPSIAGKTIGAGSKVIIQPIRVNASATVEIWGVQVEEGAYASAFEYRPIAQELALCQRYFQALPNFFVSGNRLAGGKVYTDMMLPVTMRVAPSVTIATPTYVNASALAVNNSDANRVRFETIITADGYGFAFNGALSLDAEI